MRTIIIRSLTNYVGLAWANSMATIGKDHTEKGHSLIMYGLVWNAGRIV